MQHEQDTVGGLIAVQLGLATPAQVQSAQTAEVLPALEANGVLSGAQRQMIEGMSREALAAHQGALDATVDAVAGAGGLMQTFGATAATLDGPVGGAVSVAESMDEAGLTVTREQPGRYRPPGPDPAENELGRGGIGRVLVVEDAHLGREVALKELLGQLGPGQIARPGAAMAITRFLREARITGRLEHPNIVPVYELGQRRDGTLYYTMKVVRGRTLADAFAECHTLGERLLQLKHFADLCNAVAYAHARGIIHRDLKPGNVMLGEFGETVVLDWGLARAVGEPEVRGELEAGLADGVAGLEGDPAATAEGAIVGTPLYMSPEQAAGASDLGPQADVWSLGVILYELLAGTRPFTGRSPIAVLTAIAGTDPEPIRSICPDVPPELAAVAERALSRDLDVRYADAGELAAEVGAFLMGGRVRAYRYGLGEVMARFARRHKVALGVASAAALLLVALGLWAHVQVRGERDRALAAEGEAREAETAARAAEARARAARDEAEGLVQFMVGDLRKALEPLGRLDLMDGIVKRVSVHLEESASEADESDLERVRSTADLRFAVALLDGARGRNDEAVAAATEAHRLRARLAESGGAANHLALARSELQLASLARARGDRERAAILIEGAVERLDPIVTDPSADLDALLALAVAHAAAADLLSTGGDLPGAEARLEIALKWRVALAEREPESLDWRYAVSLGHDRLGNIRLDQGDVDGAEAAYQKAMSIRQTLVEAHPDNLRWVHKLGVSHDQMGDVHLERGDVVRALKAYERATRHLTKAYTGNVEHLGWRRDAAIGRLKMADTLAALGRTDGALRTVAGVVSTLQALSAHDRREIGWIRDLNVARWRQADLLIGLGRLDEAQRLIDSSLVDAQAVSDQVPDSDRYRHDLAIAQFKSADLASRAGRITDAAVGYRAAGRALGRLIERDPSNAALLRHRRSARARLAAALADPALDRNALWAAIDRAGAAAVPRIAPSRGAAGSAFGGGLADEVEAPGRPIGELLDDALLGPAGPGESGAVRAWIGTDDRVRPLGADIGATNPRIRPDGDGVEAKEAAAEEPVVPRIRPAEAKPAEATIEEETEPDPVKPRVRPAKRSPQPRVRPAPAPAAAPRIRPAADDEADLDTEDDL